MAIPGEPVFTDETAAQVRDLLGKGAVGALFLTTDDVHAEYEALKARGVDLTEPTEQPWGIDTAFRDPSGNHIRLAQRVEIPATVSAMCLYGPPRSLTSADGLTYPASGDDRDDLEVGEVLPVGDPRLQLRDVVALHQLEAARRSAVT